MTLTMYAALIIGLVVIVGLWLKIREALRKRVYRRPFKDEWKAILQENVPLYLLLPNDLRELLHGHINYFLHNKIFVGRDEQVIDDTIRLTIAGNACLLVLNRKRRIFAGFETILVYPDTYVAKQVGYDGYVKTQHASTRAGESWYRGPIVLSWADVIKGSKDVSSGFNVVLHEFAHKLDEENEVMDGLPILRKQEHYAEWSRVLTKEYGEFLERVNKRENKVIDSYGAESPIEFFAVITESFFEKPQAMEEKLPDLYLQLKQFYGVDPAQWRRAQT